MRFLLLGFVALVWASTVAAAPAPSMASLSNQWAADWNAKILDEVMALYAPEPVFLPAVGPRWEGAATIRRNFAGLLKAYNPHIVLHSIKAESSGDLSYDSGSYEETITAVGNGKTISAKGNYLFLFQHEKRGGWKIVEQVWTSLEAPPQL